ncbi:TetR/AcrR family transcriptional regulator [Bullifex sp.]|uniref:TetR/AcrR family transcriptional regulator n=1 Tax=Bullifex sp. TaxID=2815808 RepID=UPI002A7FA32C|nr:TetR/AcrR family transcriptional regulator [Bullifex sp.]MDY4066441.1 TetR/AcrR family transcriptional regulator [Bullifex sp.]
MKKEEILKNVLTLASEKGLRSLSMADIATASGLKKSSLYSHFNSKQDLINELYLYLRKKSSTKTFVDYSTFVKGKSLREILLTATISYDEMNRKSDMITFYKVIISEKALSKEASKVIIKETETMINASKELFKAIEENKVALFDNLESAAITFALLIHSVLDLRLDAEMAESNISDGILEKVIDSFIKAYAKEL